METKKETQKKMIMRACCAVACSCSNPDKTCPCVSLCTSAEMMYNKIEEIIKSTN